MVMRLACSRSYAGGMVITGGGCGEWRSARFEGHASAQHGSDNAVFQQTSGEKRFMIPTLAMPSSGLCRAVHETEQASRLASVALVAMTLAEWPDLRERAVPSEEVWPQYNLHSDIASLLWPRLYDDLPDFQFALCDEQTGEVVAEAHTMPCWWTAHRRGCPTVWMRR